MSMLTTHTGIFFTDREGTTKQSWDKNRLDVTCINVQNGLTAASASISGIAELGHITCNGSTVLKIAEI